MSHELFKFLIYLSSLEQLHKGSPSIIISIYR